MGDKIVVILTGISALLSGITIGFFLRYHSTRYFERIFLSFYSIKLTLMVLVFMPIVLLTLVGQLWPMSKTMKSEMNSYAAAGAVAEEVHKLEKK